ncbi:MAG: ABC transporter permease [Syntrophales bacterium]|jgi:ABC-2 type transport system permease protein|nr:ABC transporter permease [Syntrophales bacterium]
MTRLIKLLYALKKEFRLITRDVQTVTILFVMPAVFIMIMSLAMRDLFELHSSVSINVLAVNRDTGKNADAFVKAIEGLPTFKFHLLEKDATTERIRKRMFAEDYKFALIIREGTSAFVAGESGEGGDKPLELLVNPSVNVQTQMVLKGALEKNLAKLRQDVLIDHLGGILQAAGIDVKKLKADNESPIELRYAHMEGRSSKVPSAVQQSVPAWLVFSIFFIVIPLSNTFISERGQGTLMRLKSMNVSRISLIVGKMIPYLLINVMQAVVMIMIGMYIVPLFGGTALTLGSSPGGLALIAISVSFSAISFALLIASLARTTEQATTIGAVLNIIFGALGGIMVPTFVMPRFMQDLANLSPMAWGLEGFLDIFLRDGRAGDVLPESLALGLFGAIMLALTLIILRRQREV